MTGASDLLLPRYLTNAGKYQTRHWKLHRHGVVLWFLNPDDLVAKEVRVINMTASHNDALIKILLFIKLYKRVQVQREFMRLLRCASLFTLHAHMHFMRLNWTWNGWPRISSELLSNKGCISLQSSSRNKVSGYPPPWLYACDLHEVQSDDVNPRHQACKMLMQIRADTLFSLTDRGGWALQNTIKDNLGR